MSTRQTDLLTQVKEFIDQYMVDQDIDPPHPVVIAFDPFRKMEDEVFRIFIIPDTYDLNIGASNRRQKVVTLMKTMYITVSFSKKFIGLDDVDIAPWDEVQPLLDLREDLSIHLATRQYVDAELIEAELNVIDEPEKNNRQFLSFLTMGFQSSESG
jgi:hypothetical protein